MHCPYCTQEIADQAIVCVHCDRDLAFFTPLNQRLKEIEERLAETESILAQAKTNEAAKTTEKTAPEKHLTIRIAIAVFAASLLNGIIGATLSFGLALEKHQPGWAGVSHSIVVLDLLPNIALALWFSTQRRIAWDLAIPWGFIKAVLGILVLSAAFRWKLSLAPVNGGYQFDLIYRELSPTRSFFLWRPLLPALCTFYSGYWLGRWYWRRKAVAQNPARSSPGGLGRLFLKQGSSEDQNSFDARVRRWNSLISAVAPILTLCGSVAATVVSLIGILDK